MKGKWSYLFLAASVLLFIYSLQLCSIRPDQERIVRIERDTVVVRDTIIIENPVPVYVDRIRTEIVYLERSEDSVKVAVNMPIEQRVYKGDKYEAIVEGFQPVLRSIKVFPEQHTIYESKFIKTPEKAKKWGVGISAGYGIGKDGVSPYIGIGVQYNLIKW